MMPFALIDRDSSSAATAAVSTFAEASLKACTALSARCDVCSDEPNKARAVERMAVALQASLLLRHAPQAVADIFAATRLERVGGLAYGALPPGAPIDAVIERAQFAE